MKNIVLVASIVMAFAVVPLIASEPPRPHTVDYVIGMLEAGMAPQAIIDLIHGKGLTFRIAEGDVDRLRAAGAGDDLVGVVTGEEATPKAVAPSQGAATPGVLSRP